MKLLFVTGDKMCECKGSGEILKRRRVKSDSNANIHLYVMVKEPCDCVQAHEATIETFRMRLPQRNIEAGKDEMVPVMVHKVVPRKE